MINTPCSACGSHYSLIKGFETYAAYPESICLYPIVKCMHCSSFFIPNKYGIPNIKCRSKSEVYAGVSIEDYTMSDYTHAGSKIQDMLVPSMQRLFKELSL